MIYLQTFAVGMFLGVVFAVLKLPVPAPSTIAGVVGILGVTIGYVVISSVLWQHT